MKTVVLPALALALSLSVSACGGSGDDDVASDPGGSGPPSSSGADVPTAVPAAPGVVSSRNLITVMDKDAKDDLVELCLGPVAESYPPQCGGPAITNWDWDSLHGVFEQQGDVRWGTFAVTGTWDGTAFTVTDAIPGALYDPAMPSPTQLPDPAVDYTDKELEAISEKLNVLPGYQGSYGADGHVLLDVTYDDGSFQDYVDATYGDGVVVVTGALVDAA